MCNYVQLCKEHMYNVLILTVLICAPEWYIGVSTQEHELGLEAEPFHVEPGKESRETHPPVDSSPADS